MSDKLHDMRSVVKTAAAISHLKKYFAKCAAEFFESTTEHSASIRRTPQQSTSSAVVILRLLIQHLSSNRRRIYIVSHTNQNHVIQFQINPRNLAQCQQDCEKNLIE